MRAPVQQPRTASLLQPHDLALGRRSSFGGRLLMRGRALRHHPRAKLGVGCQNAMAAAAMLRQGLELLAVERHGTRKGKDIRVFTVARKPG
jgi:hypothetical protein